MAWLQWGFLMMDQNGGSPCKDPLLVNAGPWIYGGDPSSAPMQMESSYKRHPTSLAILFG